MRGKMAELCPGSTTEGPLIHERQNGRGMSWEHHLSAPVARGPRDGLRTSKRFFHSCLTPPHPHYVQTGVDKAEDELAELTKLSVKMKLLKLS